MSEATYLQTQMPTDATSIGSYAASSICQMPTNATSIGSNAASKICQMPNNATPIGSSTSTSFSSPNLSTTKTTEE